MKFGGVDDIKNKYDNFKREIPGVLTSGELTGISMLNAKETIEKKMNVSFIVGFCLGKYSFSLNTSWTHPVY